MGAEQFSFAEHISAFEEEFGYDEFDESALIDGIPVSIKQLMVDIDAVIDQPAFEILIPLNRRSFRPWSPANLSVEARALKADSRLTLQHSGRFLKIELPDVSDVPPPSLIQLMRTQIQIADEEGMLKPDGCLKCGAEFTNDSEFYESEGECQACLEKRIKRRDQLEQSINEETPAFIAFLPLALMLTVASWFLVFYIFQRLTAGRESVGIPIYLILVVMAALGFAAGAPVGKVLRRSGAKFALEKPAVVTILLAAAVLVAEYLLVWVNVASAGYEMTFVIFFALLKGYTVSFLLIKLALFLGIYFGANMGAERKKVHLSDVS